MHVLPPAILISLCEAEMLACYHYCEECCHKQADDEDEVRREEPIGRQDDKTVIILVLGNGRTRMEVVAWRYLREGSRCTSEVHTCC